MHALYKITLAALCSLAFSFSSGQVNSSALNFFKGDTLNGFNTDSVFQEAMAHHLTFPELRSYMKKAEQHFVSIKYTINASGPRTVVVTHPVVTTACNNLSFETGDYTGWTGTTGYNNNSANALTLGGGAISTLGVNAAETSCSYQTLVNSGTDPFGGFPMVDPGGGSWALRLGGENINLGSSSCNDADPSTGACGGETVQQTFPVTAGNAMFTYHYAVVLNSANHNNGEMPYFRAEVLDAAGKPIPCLQYYVESASSTPPAGMFSSGGGLAFYLPWTSNSVNLKSYIGQNVTVRFTAAGCIYGGHWGYAYVDAFCSPIQVIASSPEVCKGLTISLTAPAAGTGGTYSWTSIPPGLPGIVGSSTGQSVTLDSTGTYEVTITQAPGCFYTIDTAITFWPNPIVTATSTNASCSPGSDGTATATVTNGNTPNTYVWSPPPGVGQGTATPSSMAAGTYNLAVTTVNGCKGSTSVIITQPNAPTLSPGSTNVSCFGKNDGTASVMVAGGTAPFTYTWTGAGYGGGGQGTANATGLGAGTYVCNVGDSKSCSATISIVITEPALLTVSAVGISTTCKGKCDGQLICIPAGGTTIYVYSWTTGCLKASCNGVCSGIYTATITDAHGCVASDTALVAEPSALVLSLFPKAAHCNKSDGADSVAASGGTPGYTYSWSPGPGVSTAAYHNIPASTYTVIVKDNHGCSDTSINNVTNLPGVALTLVKSTDVSCFGGSDGSATVLAAGGFPAYTYSWSPSPSIGVTDSGLKAGAYTCSVTDSAHCLSTISVVINQPPQLTLTASPAITICIGQCTDLTALANGGTPGYTYSWTLNGIALPSEHVCPLLSTTYTVGCTDSHGCMATPAMVTVTVNPPLEVLTASAANICPGGSDTLHASGSGGNGSYFYVWSPATGLSNANLQNPVATPAISTTYTVIISDNCGTPTDSATVSVTLWPPPVVTFVSTDTVACAPVCINFSGASNPACASGLWSFGDGGTEGGCNTARHCYNQAGTYNVTYHVTDIHGCKGSLTIPNFINALPRPVAAFNASPQPATIVNPEIWFTDQSTNAISWAWSFGDLSNATSSLQNPNYTYPDTGCYPVTLVVTAADGCTDIATAPVCIDPEFTFYAPNTFTPNGDGKNEIWMPFGIGIDPKNYELMMFDRWGSLIFETDVWGEGWDGRANKGGSIAQIDTYVWKVNLKDFKGNKHSYSGHCNLIK
jgi:gliding motility-associated-like protein